MSLDRNVLSTLRAGSDVYSRHRERIRAHGELCALRVEVFEQQAGCPPVGTVLAIRPAHGLNHSALGSAQCIAASISQIPLGVRCAIKAVSLTPDETHRRASGDVFAKRPGKREKEPICAGAAAGAFPEEPFFGTSDGKRTGCEAGDPVPLPVPAGLARTCVQK